MPTNSFEPAIVAGLLSFPAALVAVVLLVRGWHIVIAFGVGLCCLVPGYMIGVDRFCSLEGAGNLCGLGAVFGTAPLGFAFGAAGYAALRRFCSRGAKKAETAARRVA
jgi:hypothetical protein